MPTYCAPLVADILFYNKRNFVLSFFENNQADISKAFNSTSRYLDDLLKINHLYFE